MLDGLSLEKSLPIERQVCKLQVCSVAIEGHLKRNWHIVGAGFKHWVILTPIIASTAHMRSYYESIAPRIINKNLLHLIQF